MKILYWTIPLLLLLTKSVSAQNEQKIIWHESRLLSWTDFKGQPHDSSFAAATYCSIETKICKQNVWNGKITLSIEATFFPDTSWYQESKVHALTLRHEQGHFDIAEWFSRKLRKIIQDEIKFIRDYNQKFQTIYDKVYGEYFLTQKKYERETEFGSKPDEQIKWETTIKSQLSELKNYKNNDCTQ